MTTIFSALYSVHPALPAIYLVLFINGVLAPNVYCVVQRMPVDISRIWNLARQDKVGAKFVIWSWVVFGLVSVLVLVLVLLRWLV